MYSSVEVFCLLAGSHFQLGEPEQILMGGLNTEVSLPTGSLDFKTTHWARKKCGLILKVVLKYGNIFIENLSVVSLLMDGLKIKGGLN